LNFIRNVSLREGETIKTNVISGIQKKKNVKIKKAF